MTLKLNKIQGDIYAEIDLPASKSINNRVLIIDALTGFKCNIEHQSTAEDTQSLIRILKQFQEGEIKFDVGPAGTTMRFLTAYFSTQKGVQILTGSERMKQRPIHVLVNALNQLGANIEYLEKEGFPPLKINESNFVKNEIEIDGGVSSQYISALMLMAPTLEGGLKISMVNDVVSIPYLLMTKNIMQYFGADVSFDDRAFSIKQKPYQTKEFYVEGDWSGASYWYSVVALSENVSIKINGLKENSLQGDNVVAKIYEKFGVTTEYQNDAIVISKSKDFSLPNKFEYDFTDCPDLAQTVVVTCLGLGIDAKCYGLKTLKIKETDRLQALKNECEKLGSKVEITNDSLVLLSAQLRSAIIATYDDHRMAMAFAPLAAKIDLEIEDEQVVKKSYPTFWHDFEKINN